MVEPVADVHVEDDLVIHEAGEGSVCRRRTRDGHPDRASAGPRASPDSHRALHAASAAGDSRRACPASRSSRRQPTRTRDPRRCVRGPRYATSPCPGSRRRRCRYHRPAPLDEPVVQLHLAWGQQALGSLGRPCPDWPWRLGLLRLDILVRREPDSAASDAEEHQQSSQHRNTGYRTPGSRQSPGAGRVTAWLVSSSGTPAIEQDRAASLLRACYAGSCRIRRPQVGPSQGRGACGERGRRNSHWLYGA